MKERMKKITSILMLGVMVFSLTACGGTSEETSEEPAAEETVEAGSTLNIWCWNDEFQSRFNDYYPGVKEVAEDKSTTTLEDGTIIPFFVYYDTLYNDDALSETIEKYINKYVGDSEYINDAKTNVNKLIDDLYKKAVDDYILLMNKCDYSEEYKMNKLKEKYKSLF